MLKRNLIFFIFLLNLSQVVAAPRKSDLNSNFKNIAAIQKNYKKLNKEFNESKNSLFSIEKNLSSSNKEYLRSLKNSQIIYQELLKIDDRLQKNTVALVSEKEKIKSLIKLLVINEIDSNSTDEKLIESKLINEILKKLQHETKELTKIVEHLNFESQKLRGNFEDLKKNQFTLLDSIRNLESEKIAVSNKYLFIKKERDEMKGLIERDRIKRKKRMRKALASKKSKKVRNSAVSFKVPSPLESFTKIEESKNAGITYEFTSEAPIKSPANGVVNYVGRLANYGKVIIIDHGKEIRSVFLGEFSPKVKQGKKLSIGEIIGYTKLTKSEEGKLYFEVRKKDVAQKTIDWLDFKIDKKKKIIVRR